MPALERAEAYRRLGQARIARLATVRPDGSPHIVPCVFALLDDTIFTPVDRKPKRSSALQRLRNIEHEPRVALLADEYDDGAWERLWWVRADGRARIVEAGAEHERGMELLAQKYAQYRRDQPDDAIIVITIERVIGWRYA